MSPLTGNRKATPIGLFHLAIPTLDTLAPFQTRLCLKGIWCALNGKSSVQKPGNFSTVTYISYAVNCLDSLATFQQTVIQRCNDLGELFSTDLSVPVGVKNVYELFMNQFCL